MPVIGAGANGATRSGADIPSTDQQVPGTMPAPGGCLHYEGRPLPAGSMNLRGRIRLEDTAQRARRLAPSGRRAQQIAALYVETTGAYSSLPGVDPWDVQRDARTYAGPHPVVAHPPCERWGRFWHGSPRKPHQFAKGDDGGCFAAALASVRAWGGVLEHPADSHAWAAHGLNAPPRSGGWVAADFLGGWTCYVEQGFYGHSARKPTWLYANGVTLPSLRWGRGEQRLCPVVLARHGYAYARRQGVVSLIGGKDKKAKRNATPAEFRDLLVSIALTAEQRHAA